MIWQRTHNFSGAEIEGLVKSAANTAMNGLIKVCHASKRFVEYCAEISVVLLLRYSLKMVSATK